MAKTPDLGSILAMLGVSDTVAVEKATAAAEIRHEVYEDSKSVRANEMRAVLQSLHYPHEFRLMKCGFCNNPFKTNYCSDAYCSIECMRSALVRTFGNWPAQSPKKYLTEYEPALKIRPDALRKIYEWAKTFVQEYEYIDSVHDQPMPDFKSQPNPQRVRHTPHGQTVVEYVSVSLQSFPLSEVLKEDSQVTQETHSHSSAPVQEKEHSDQSPQKLVDPHDGKTSQPLQLPESERKTATSPSLDLDDMLRELGLG